MAPAQVVGASGGVTAVFILFVLYYPRETLYFWGLFAVPGLDSGGGGHWHESPQWFDRQCRQRGVAGPYRRCRLRLSVPAIGWKFSRYVPAPGRWQDGKWPAAAARLKCTVPRRTTSHSTRRPTGSSEIAPRRGSRA